MDTTESDDCLPDPILQVQDLAVEFNLGGEVVRAVNGLTYDVGHGEMVSIVGESGSGKSVSVLAVLGMIDNPPGRISKGSIRLNGKELVGLRQKDYRRIRGESLSIILQDALTSLSPGHTVGSQIAEMFRYHRGLSKREGLKRAVDLLDRVQIPDAASRVNDYPHEFSGGMRQRVMIAIGVALDPILLIADEPTTALDVTVQAEILELLGDLQNETRMGMVLITHDLSVVGDYADQVVVMYAGRAVERGPTSELFANPKHPYTNGLLESIPARVEPNDRLVGIPGNPPILTDLPAGCSFTPRCAIASGECYDIDPPERASTSSAFYRCHHPDQVSAVSREGR